MKRYLHSLLAEYWKFGQTWSAFIWLVTPLLLFIGHFIALYVQGEAGYHRYVAFFGHQSPWHYLYQSYSYIQALLWPLLSIFMAVSIIGHELKSEMWRSCPIALQRQLWSKWVIMALLIAAGLLIGWLSVWGASIFLSNTLELPFDYFQQDTAYMSIRFLQLYPVLLAVATLHFWLSLYSRANVLLNIALPLVTLPFDHYTPYGLLYQWWRLHSNYLDAATEQAWTAWAIHTPLWPSISWIALLIVAILHIIGYFTFKKKKSWILSQ